MNNKIGEFSNATGLAADWRELEVELGRFGTQLEDMRGQPELIGQSVIEDLEQRYEDIARQVLELKAKTADAISSSDSGTEEAGRLGLRDGLETVKEKAGQLGRQVAGAAGVAGEAIQSKASELDEQTRPYREEASKVAAETGERVKLAAKDVGHGFGIAWEALKRDFENAYSRLSDGADERRDEKF